jgi:hypothetical protein
VAAPGHNEGETGNDEAVYQSDEGRQRRCHGDANQLTSLKIGDRVN